MTEPGGYHPEEVLATSFPPPRRPAARVQGQWCGPLGRGSEAACGPALPPAPEPGGKSPAPAARRKKRAVPLAALRFLPVARASGDFFDSGVSAIFRRRPGCCACFCSRREAAARSSGVAGGENKKKKGEEGAARTL